ncbi:Laminin subunit alpha-5, partial [Ophiophagus hannah]
MAPVRISLAAATASQTTQENTVMLVQTITWTSPIAITVIATLLGQEATPAGKMLKLGCVCVSLTFKGHSVISVYLATMDQIANLVRVTFGARWTAIATPLVNATAIRIMSVKGATTVPQASMASLLAQVLVTCLCSIEGSLYDTCNQETGQCTCRPRVSGLRCDACISGAYGFPDCQVGSCNPAGLVHEDHSLPEGSCECRAYVEGCQCNTLGTIAGVAECQQSINQSINLSLRVMDTVSANRTFAAKSVLLVERDTSIWRAAITLAVKDAIVTSGDRLVLCVRRQRDLVSAGTISGDLHALTQGSVKSPDLFFLVFCSTNQGPAKGRVSVLQERKFNMYGNCTEQTKQIVFGPTQEPTFVTVPHHSFGEPFVLSPHVWSLIIEAEDVLLDYLVLLPSSYYEAPILQYKVSDPCTYSPAPEHVGQNCFLYKYMPVEQFSFVSGEDALCKLNNNLPRPCPVERIFPTFPRLVLCSGTHVEVQLIISVPQPGRYVLLMEYANEDTPQTIETYWENATLEFDPLLFFLSRSFLCRGIVVDSQNRLAAFELDTEARVQFTADQARFFLYKVHLIPYEQFTLEFLEPKVHCISTQGALSLNSSSCVPSRYQKISQSVVLEEGQSLPIAPDLPLIHAISIPPEGSLPASAPQPPTLIDNSAKLIFLRAPQ